MVKINLLPIKAELKRKALAEHIVFLILTVILLIIGVTFVQSSVRQKKEAIQQEIVSTKLEIKKLTAIAGQIEAFKKHRQELETKLGIIKNLRKKKTGPVEILDQLRLIIPEKAWLTSLNNTGSSLVLHGSAVDNPTIAQFMKNLEISPYFTDVVLVYSRQAKNRHRFVINCKVKIPS